MKSKSLEYIKSLGKKPEELPEKYRENLEVMQEFAEIYSLVEPGSDEAKEAKSEYEDYDENILEALKRDYPQNETPAAEESKESPKPPEKPEEAPKAKKASKPRKKAKPEKQPAPDRVTEYSWKDKAKLNELSPVVIHCQHYHLEAKEEMEVGMKGKGNATRKVPVKPGEHLIFDDGGYLVFVMDAESFSRKCIEQMTVEQHEKLKHKGAAEDTPKPAPKPEEKPKPAPQAEKEPEEKQNAAPKPEDKPEEKKPKAAPKAKAKKASKPRKAEAKKPKQAPESSPAAKSENTTISSIEKEINDIRIAQGKKPLDREVFRKEYQDLEEKKDTKSYLAYIRKQLKQAQDEGVEFGEKEIINLGIAIRPLIQRKGAALLDILLTSKKVLAPTYDNLIRWTETPGRYDLQGVDISAKAKESVKARKVEKPSLYEMIGL